jgi:hypothetical protein
MSVWIIPRKPQPEQQPPPPLPLPPPPKPQALSFTKRLPSESALRSMAATTTANTFVMKNRQISSTNLFTTATTTITTPPSPFQFRGFSSNAPSM